MGMVVRLGMVLHINIIRTAARVSLDGCRRHEFICTCLNVRSFLKDTIGTWQPYLPGAIGCKRAKFSTECVVVISALARLSSSKSKFSRV